MVDNSAVSGASHVADNAVIKSSTLTGENWIGARAFVDNSRLEGGVRIGKFVTVHDQALSNTELPDQGR